MALGRQHDLLANVKFSNSNKCRGRFTNLWAGYLLILSFLTISKSLPEGFAEWDGLIVYLGKVKLADPGAGHWGPVVFISATGLDPLVTQLGIVQGKREECYLRSRLCWA
jgi:hypothetical protein